MIVQIDSREPESARKRICKQLDKLGVKWFVSKLYCGDYCNPVSPTVLIERKKSIGELAQNVTVQYARFKAELDRAKSLGAKLHIVVEEKCINRAPITELSDLINWHSPYTQVSGERVFRLLCGLQRKYAISISFCAKSETGAKIIELIELGGKK